MHLIYHYSGADGRTFYQADFRNAYNLLRSGAVISLVEGTLGHEAASIITQVLHLGHSTAGYLKRHLMKSSSQSREQRPEQQVPEESGHLSVDHNVLRDQRPKVDIDGLLYQLIMKGWILRVREAHFHTSADNRHEAELSVRGSNALATSKGRKAQDEYGRLIEKEISQRNEAAFTLSRSFNDSNPSLKRRHVDDSLGIVNKKARPASGGRAHGSGGTAGNGDIDVRVSNFRNNSNLTKDRMILFFA